MLHDEATSLGGEDPVDKASAIAAHNLQLAA